MTLHIGAPQAIYLILIVWGAIIGIRKHGTVSDGPYDAWNSALADFVVIMLLLWGGFFS